MTAALTTIAIILAVAAEVTVMQAEETSLAHIQTSTTTPRSFTPATGGPYNVTFSLSSQCWGRAVGWGISQWGVTFANVTKTYPLNANVSQIESGVFSLFVSNQSASSITFTVPDGEYTYRLFPNSLEVFTGPANQQVRGATGVIGVTGSNVEFCVADEAVVA